MPSDYGARDEKALQSRRRTDQRTTSKDAGAKAWQCATKDVERSKSSSAGKETEVARLTRELNEALEQQTATSEVLGVISASRGELEPVFQAMLQRAIRICEAEAGALYRFDGNAFHLAAQVGASRELAELRTASPSVETRPSVHCSKGSLSRNPHLNSVSGWIAPIISKTEG